MSKSFRGFSVVALLGIVFTLFSPWLPQIDVATKTDVGSNQNHARGPRSGSAAGEESKTQVLRRLPMRFEKNVGQTDRRVKYAARGPGYSLFLTGTQAVFSLRRSGAGQGRDSRLNVGPGKAAGSDIVRMTLMGADKRAHVQGANRASGKTNYFLGDNPAAWKVDVPTYAKVVYHGVYPGIDMVFYGRGESLEYDFTVMPGADPKKIGLRIEGAQKLQLDRTGNLIISTEGGTLRQRRPQIFQRVDGGRRIVNGSFVLDRDQVGFRIGAYDRRLPLVIDPVITYSSHFGGLGDGSVRGMDVDSAGNVYLTGHDTGSGAFPTQAAFQPAERGLGDAWVAKLSPGGSELVYSTYLGGSQIDAGQDIAADSSGSAYVTGATGSPDFFTTGHNALQPSGARLFRDAFLTKFDPGGVPVYSTFLGGEGDEIAEEVAVEGASGRAFVTGTTSSDDDPSTEALNEGFPLKRPLQDRLAGAGSDAFLSVIDTTKSGRDSLAFSTVLGREGNQRGWAVDVHSGVAYVAGDVDGDTPSSSISPKGAFQDSPAGGHDAFLTAIDTRENAIEPLLYSTYLGGSGSETGLGVAVDPLTRRVWVAGQTDSGSLPSPPFPLEAAFQPGFAGGLADGFAATFDPKLAGSGSLLYFTFLGGDGYDVIEGVSIDRLSGQASLAGASGSSNFPSRRPLAGFEDHKGAFDAVVARMDAGLAGDGSLLYSSFLGGTGSDAAAPIDGDEEGNVWIAGSTSGGGYPTTENAFQRKNGVPNSLPLQEDRNSSDGLFAKLRAVLPVVNRLDPPKGPVSGGTKVTIEGENLGGAYRVKFGDTEAPKPIPDPASPATRLTVESPPHAAGPVHVSVLTHEGISRQTPADIFTYENVPIPPGGVDEKQPFIAAVAPDRGPTSGGTPVLISGIRFRDATEVRFGEVVIPAGRFSSISDSDIRLATPPHDRAETVKVRVVTLEGVSNAADFTYIADPVSAVVAAPPREAASSDAASASRITTSQRPLLHAPPGGGGLPAAPSTAPVPVLQSAPANAPAPGPEVAPGSIASHMPVAESAGLPAIGAVGVAEEKVEPAPSGYQMTAHAERQLPALGLSVLGAVTYACCIIRIAGRRRVCRLGLDERQRPAAALAGGWSAGGSS